MDADTPSETWWTIALGWTLSERRRFLFFDIPPFCTFLIVRWRAFEIKRVRIGATEENGKSWWRFGVFGICAFEEGLLQHCIQYMDGRTEF